MNFDLKKPCKNCPFADTLDRIVFRGRDRAAEIAEGAYRQGFPCHLSAELIDDYDGYGGGYHPTEGTQHCAGALAMFYQSEFQSPWPGIGNDEDEVDRIYQRMGANIDIAFKSEEAFIAANHDERIDGPKSS